MFFLINLFLVSTLYFSKDVIAFERQLGVLNFTCTNSEHSVIHKVTIIEAKGNEDVLYHFWDFGIKPTFLIVQVPKNTKVKLDCTRFLNNETNSITFTSKPLFMFGVMLNKVYEFSDENDTATFNPNSTKVRTYDAEDFSWNITSFSENTLPIPLDALKIVGKRFNSSDSGQLEMAVGAYTGDGSSIDPPHILHTANGSQVDINFNNFRTTFNKSRFSVQLIVFSSLAELNYTSAVKSTTDDENTPSVFKLNTIIFDRPKKLESYKAYLLWRPVVYTTEQKVVANTTGMKEYNITDIDSKDSVFNHTLLKAIYGYDVKLFAKSLTISFGSRTDKFYQKTKYSSWSFVFGTGDPPDPDTNSFFFLLFFCGCGILSIALAFLIARGWIKLPNFCGNISRSQENLVHN